MTRRGYPSRAHSSMGRLLARERLRCKLIPRLSPCSPCCPGGLSWERLSRRSRST